jgi:hypothetical protein
MFMWHTTVLFLFLSTFPVLITSLQCYSCDDVIIANYIVTSETVPSFSQCQIIDAAQCLITVTWDENINITSITVNTQNTSVPNPPEDLIKPMALVEIGPYGGVPYFAHNLVVSCMSSDKCNNETSLQQILRSLTLEDQFRAELIPLIHVVYPFNPTTAACLDFHNGTGSCPPIDLTDCQRCEISVDQILSIPPEVCATCHRSSVDVNVVIHSATFSLTSRTRLVDHVQLGCQSKTCNSIANINAVYKASNITFNFAKFFENF